MTQQLKLTSTPIFELAKAKGTNYNLNLLGVKKLAQYFEPVRNSLENNEIKECNCFKEQYCEGEEFFYLAQMVDVNKGPLMTEVGVGRLTCKGTELERIRPIYYFRNSDQPKPCLNGPMEFFSDDEDKYVLVRNYIPTNLVELFIQTNSIIVSGAEEYVPKAIQIPNDSIVGRLDKEIQPIKISDISSIGIEAIQKYTKQIILKSSQLNVDKIKTKQLLISPCSKPDAKKGTIIYNEKDDTLKYYTGKKWRTLLFKDDP